MMAQKHLRDLLVEDQEPFLLDAYISSRRLQLNKPPRPPSLRKSPSFLKNANSCFSSSSSFPCHPSNNSSSSLLPRLDAATSAARVRSKAAGDNTLLLRVPTRTAALLLEAALRIESYGLKDCGPPHRKKQGKSGESLFRKFTRFGRLSRKKEFGGCKGDDGVLVRDILRLDNYGERQNQGKTNAINNSIASRKASIYAGKCPCSTSDTLEAHLYESEQIRGRESFSGSEGSGPGRSPSRYPTPELRSPTVASPTRSLPMDKANDEESDPRDVWPDEEEEVEKEQSSPVSVLDPSSYHEEDVNTREHRDAEDPDDNDGYEYENVDRGIIDYEASYTRTKQQLLRKLYMFERLAGLDPVELKEQLIVQDDSEDEDVDGDVVTERGGDDPARRRVRVTRGTMRLVSNLILGEQQEVKKPGGGMDMAIQGYYRRNGMVRRDEEEDHLEDTAEEIEVSILGFLVEELSEELCLQWGVFDLLLLHMATEK
ncbi:hypothetical protein MLD38_019603 [Melastoma candidum]|uniref:Uncharacterized protein n=2 Tax=Melastoma candidum TaxID=119954 RepID=A0ACB9QYS7_9MYRT|nr:hypothetical protein MLD38_019603 [Melastoma candidum]